MIDIWMLLNMMANFLIVVGGSFFVIFVFGRKSKAIESLPPFERGIIKVALSFTVSGSLFNLLDVQPIPWSEVILNFGIGGIFVWGSLFHFKQFVWKKKK